jgi:glycosyltransferase involved in cell wall biosynthesis
MRTDLLLTISIPTFNRDEYLRRQLARLTPQVQGRQDVEILICDNGSSPATSNVVSEAQARSKCVRYFRHKRNVGLDLNVYTAYQQARGKYVWFLADDDMADEAAVAKILAQVGSCHSAVLTMGSRDVGSSADHDVHQKTADYGNWAEAGAVDAFLSVIMLSRLVVQRLPIRLDDLVVLPPTVFPQVTLCLRVLEHTFSLATRSEVVITRLPGHVTKNFFELYCLGVRRAVQYAGWDVGAQKLLRATERSLREFVHLQWLERLDHYESKLGLPIASWRQGWKEYGRHVNQWRFLFAILLVSRIPKRAARFIFLLSRTVRTLSFRHAVQDLENLHNWRAHSRAADV